MAILAEINSNVGMVVVLLSLVSIENVEKLLIEQIEKQQNKKLILMNE